ncbi:prepilin-type N-terminal cleavage/methylation domain-containing protein [Clostridium sp. 'White wine YQ']|uniref:prepilin-type N-terminal cleavage/methylation domain-containing protein n=1 Tax=Clostridium sp. 'White wine YQ' TaxID=3027474 RepID=UPI002366B1D5|nr:prepilin-type N-terminal cleavage/methylation domain-containing protein [Clostridium sp. 'White wine YQ']MDD7795761.1 prepilin-type N-terminal cleavage/methylation domain-containing protein [Clostridium sp. 'White wine YQ']
MKKRKKAFTIIELLLVLALSAVVLGVVFSFFLSNTRTINATGVNSDLQEEAQDITQKITKDLMEAESIRTIINSESVDVLTRNSCDISRVEIGFLTVESVTYLLSGSNLTKNGEVIGKDVQSLNVETLDGRSFSQTKGVKITINLSKDFANETYTYKSSTNIIFRNKDATI